jgi:hypothetical protein
MKCPIETGENSELFAYSEEKLDAARAGILKRHVEECAACREFVEGQRAVWSALDAWEPPAISADFDKRLYRLLNEPAPSGLWERWLRPLLAHKSVPLAAAACLVVVVGLVMRPGVQSTERPRTSQGQPVQALQAEQVEHALDDIEMLGDFTRSARADAGEL